MIWASLEIYKIVPKFNSTKRTVRVILLSKEASEHSNLSEKFDTDGEAVFVIYLENIFRI